MLCMLDKKTEQNVSSLTLIQNLNVILIKICIEIFRGEMTQ